VKSELEIITSTAAKAMESMDEEAKAKFNDDVMTFSATEKGRAN
jgi:hypothetical protein